LRKVLATDLGIWPVVEHPHEIADAMVASREIKSSLANYILLYDQVFIPTGNLLIVPVLRNMLGEDIFDELVKNNALVFARYDKWFVYGGNGRGLTFFSAHSNHEHNNLNLGKSFFSPLDECIDTVLRRTTPIANADRKRFLTNLLLDKVVPAATNIQPKTFRDETYKDILGSPYLRQFLNFKSNNKSLNNIKGVEPNQLILSASPHIKNVSGKNPEIMAVLHAAFENFVLGIGADLKVNEITGDDYSLSLLKAKGQRVGMPIEGQKAFAKIQEISGVPDVGLAFANNQITAEQLLDLRELKSAENFRKWLNTAHQPQNSHKDIVNTFVESLRQTAFADSYLMKTLRLVTTTAIGLSNGSAGVAACWLDTFLLNEWFPDKSPRLFLKQIKSVVIKSAEKEKVIVASPKQSGRDRNRPCSCGSGQKYKYCCGRENNS